MPTTATCAHAAGCKKPRLRHERFCFDHLDQDEIERANSETAEEDELVERVRELEVRKETTDMSTTKERPAKRGGEFNCKCGRTFAYGGAYAKHALGCPSAKGEAPTQSRIAASSAAEPVSRRSARRVTTPKRRKQVRPAKRAVRVKRHADRTPPEVAPVTMAAMLAALRAEAVKIQNAIAALEALA